jgi:hypothetical protein
MDPEDRMSDIPIEKEGHSASLSMADVDFAKETSENTDRLTPTREEEEEGERHEFAAAAPRGKKQCGMWCLIPLLLALVLVVGLGAGLGARQKKNNQSKNSSTTGTNAPTTTTGPRATLADITGWLASNGASDKTALITPGTPQFMAATWLATEDKLALALPTTTSLGYLYTTRYVMALVYYQLNGVNWDSQLKFLTEEPVCAWNGLKRAFGGNGVEIAGLQCNSESGLPTKLDLGAYHMCACAANRCL